MANKARRNRDWFKMNQAAHMAERLGGAVDYIPWDSCFLDDEDYGRMHHGGEPLDYSQDTYY
jgi:hypothetical protein